MSNLADKKIA